MVDSNFRSATDDLGVFLPRERCLVRAMRRGLQCLRPSHDVRGGGTIDSVGFALSGRRLELAESRGLRSSGLAFETASVEGDDLGR